MRSARRIVESLWAMTKTSRDALVSSKVSTSATSAAGSSAAVGSSHSYVTTTLTRPRFCTRAYLALTSPFGCAEMRSAGK